MACRTTQIYQATLCQHDNPTTCWKNYMIYLWFNVLPLIFLNGRNIYLRIEVANITNDGLIFHFQHVIMSDYTQITCCCNKNIGLITGLVHSNNTVTLHRCLKSANRIYLRNPYSSSKPTQGLGTTLAHISKTTY